MGIGGGLDLEAVWPRLLFVGTDPRAERRVRRALLTDATTPEPLCATSLAAAEQVAEGMVVDIVMLDMSSPEAAADLPGAVGRLLDRFPAARVILLGWTGDGEQLVAALRAGAAGVVDRQIGPEALYRTFLALRRGEAVLPRMQAGALIQALCDPHQDQARAASPGLEHALEAAIRQRDEAFAVISHDLGQPLSTLQVALPILRDDLAETHPDLLALLRSAESATARMSAMVRELLDVARLQAGEPLRLQRTPLDLVSLLHDAIQFQRAPDDVSIRLEARPPAVWGEWDGPRLERVFANLLDNAVKYSPDGGRVIVIVSAAQTGDPGWATVEVTDSGIGIPSADLPRLFTRFHRGLNVGQAKGTGLGLAGARQIVEQHGGTIEIESAEGEGTSVTVRLPLA